VQSTNIAPDLDPSVIDRLGSDVVQGYELDVASRADWQKLTEAGLKIAMQVIEPKTYPWPGSANVKHPLIATAAIQFAARAYPEIVKGIDVVKARVVGEDPDGRKEQRAKRVSQHMSWQLIEQITEWDEDTDKLLHSLPVMGICYRKTYWDPMYQRPASEGRSALQVVVNHKTKSLEKCRRVTDEVWLYKNEVIERERSGLFVEDIWKQLHGDDEEKPQELFLEQHCWSDLDGDGYEEPYIVTVHRDSGKVARIVARYDEAGIIRGTNSREVARIEPVQYFTKYGFIPAPDGSYHDLGFAQLLSPLNETMNTILNQLLDAGTLHNLGGGFVGKGVKWSGGKMTFIPGEWKNVDVTGGVLKDNVVPLPTKEPSAVLFQLLGLIAEAGNRLASVSETMTGETPGQNVPATTVLAMIEQGLKVFTSIYKRVYRSLKSEYKKLYRLNRLYLNEKEYYRILDDGGAVFKADYDAEDLDIVPVADPTISSEAQRLARARAQFETMDRNPSIAGRIEILRRYYEALNAPDIDKLMPPKEMEQIANPQQPPPDPAVMKLEADIMKQKNDFELAVDKMDLDRMKMEAEIGLIKANTILAIATAESKEVGQQFELYKHDMETLTEFVKMQMDAHQRGKENAAADADRKIAAGESGDSAESDTGSPGGMEAAPGNQGGAPVPPGGAGGLPGADGGGINLESQLGGANSAADLQAVGRDLRGNFNAGNQTP
jgi:chaperonin GroES